MTTNKKGFRVVLHPVVQKTLFEHYRILYGGYTTRAAASLGISQVHYWNYENIRQKTVPEDIFYEISGTLMFYRDNWKADPARIKSDPDYRRACLKLYRGILGGSNKDMLNSIREKKRGREKAQLISETINDFSLGGYLNFDNNESLIKAREAYGDVVTRGARDFIALIGMNPELKKEFYRRQGQRRDETMKSKYGEDWLKILHNRGQEGLRRSLGPNYNKELADRMKKALEEVYGSDCRKLLQAMTSLRVSKEKIIAMKQEGYLDIIEKLGSKERGCTRGALSEELLTNPYIILERCRQLQKKRFIGKSGRIGKRIKLTERGERLLWVYEKLKAAKRI